MSSDQLSLVRKFSYGVGHVLNDLSASMWFSYLLIYLHRVVYFQNATAGYMMLLGQVADALATAFVGFESDRTKEGLWLEIADYSILMTIICLLIDFFYTISNYGRRKSWHLVGVICTLISFPFMFNLCPTCENAPEWARFYYYAPFVVIFQFGWASTQISHLSLIPQLTVIENERVSLNAIRYAFTVMSNLFVYVVTYLFLRLNDSDPTTDDTHLTRADAPKFMYLSAIVCVVGLLFQVIFHLGTNEKRLLSDDEIHESHAVATNSNEMRLDWHGYLKKPRFYNLGLLYMCTRLIVNMTQVYLPMYLTDTLQLDKSSIALIPLICYLSGFLSTFPLRLLNKYLGCYIKYSIGVVFILICSALFWFHDKFEGIVAAVIAAVFLGAGSTVILVTSLTLTTDLIGKNTGSGAFIFGAMSFTDKLSNGIAVALLQQFSPCQVNTLTCNCKDYYHRIMSFLPSICAIISFFALLGLCLTRKPAQTAPSINNVQINSDEDVIDEDAPLLQNGKHGKEPLNNYNSL